MPGLIVWYYLGQYRLILTEIRVPAGISVACSFKKHRKGLSRNYWVHAFAVAGKLMPIDKA